MELTDYIGIVTAAYTVASIVVRAIKTKNSDEIVTYLGKFMNILFEATRKK